MFHPFYMHFPCIFNQKASVTVCVQADESMEDAFDGPLTLPLIAPRDLLVINGSKDPRCPLEGVEICIAKAKEAALGPQK